MSTEHNNRSNNSSNTSPPDPRERHQQQFIETFDKQSLSELCNCLNSHNRCRLFSIASQRIHLRCNLLPEGEKGDLHEKEGRADGGGKPQFIVVAEHRTISAERQP